MFVAPIAAQSLLVFTPFSRSFKFRNKHGFPCIDVSQVARESLETESDRSGGNRGNLDQSIVRG